MKNIFKRWAKLKKTYTKVYSKKIKPLFLKNRRKLILFWRRRPFVSFASFLVLLLALIVLGNVWRDRREEEVAREQPPKQVAVFAIGRASKVKHQGKVEKAGTVTVVAQAGGIVRKVNVFHGQKIGQGFGLIQLSSNYQGGNLPALQRNLAYQQYAFNQDNFEKQKEIINNQKKLTEKTVDNAGELREIGRRAVEDSQSQLELNQSILGSIENNLTTLREATQSAENDALILATQQLQSQFLAAVNQLRQLIRTSEYQSDDDKLPTELGSLQKDITLQQLYIQEKSLSLNLEVSRINYQIAQIAASLMLPASPFAATVERVHVRPGQLVSPGQPLVTLSGAVDSMRLVVKVAPSLARRISKIDTATVFLPSGPIEIVPLHITLEPVLDNQHRVVFDLPTKFSQSVFDGQFLSVNIPLGYADSPSTIPSIPLDSVYQLQKESFVYLVEDSRATSRKIDLGQVLGSYVEILEGLGLGDLLITSRNVNQGDAVEPIDQ